MTSNSISGFGKSTDNAFNLDIDHLTVNQGEDVSGTAVFNNDVIFNGDIIFDGHIQINEDVDVVGNVKANTFTATAASNQFTVQNASEFDFKVSTSTTPVFKFLDSNNSLSTSTIEANIINATTINNTKTISTGTSNTTLSSSQKNSSTSAGAEAGYKTLNSDNTSMGIYMQSTAGGKRGKVRSSSDAFGIDILTEGYGLGNNKSIKLYSDHTTIDSDLSCLQGFTVYGASEFHNISTFYDAVDITGHVQIDDSLTVLGLTETQELHVTSNTVAYSDITGAFQSQGGLGVARKSFFRPNWEIPTGYSVPSDSIQGAVIFERPIWLSQDTINQPFFAATVYIKGPPALGNNISAANQILACSLIVEAKTQVDDLFVTGDVTIAGAFTMAGLSTFNGASIFNGATTVNGAFTCNGAGSFLGGTFNVAVAAAVNIGAGAALNLTAGLGSSWTAGGGINISAGGLIGISSGATLSLSSVGLTTINSTAAMNILAGAVMQVEAVGTLGISTGGMLQLNAGGQILSTAAGDYAITAGIALNLTSTGAMTMNAGFTLEMAASEFITMSSLTDISLSVTTGTINLNCIGGAISLGTGGGAIELASGAGAIDITTAAGALALTTGTGALTLTTGTGAMTLTTGAGGLAINLAAGAFSVGTGGGLASISTGAGALTLTTAAGVMTLTTGSGALTLTTGTGTINLTTGVGAMTFTCGTGGLAINIAAGAFSVGTGGGLASITTGAGALSLTTAAGAMTLTTGSGALTLTTGTGTVNLTTGVGAMTFTCGTGGLAINIGAGAFAVNTGGGIASISTGAGALNLTTGTGTMNLTMGGGAFNLTTGGGVLNMTTGTGALNITTGAGALTINCGAGGMAVDVGTGALTMTTGAGACTINCGAGGMAVNLGTGAMTFTVGAGGLAMTAGGGAIGITTGVGIVSITTGVGAIQLTTGVGAINMITAGGAVGIAAGVAGDVTLGTGSGNINVQAGTGCVNLLANSGGINVGCTSESDMTHKTAHFVVRTINGSTAPQTGNIIMTTHTQSGIAITGPGNVTIDTSDARLGNMFLRSKGSFQLISDQGSETGGIYINTTASNSSGQAWTWKFPSGPGTSGQVLTSGGSGTQTWSTALVADANGNISANNFFSNFFEISNASPSPYNMTAASPPLNYSTRTGGAINVFLPDATTLPKGATIYFNINGTATINVKRFGSGTLASLVQGTFTTFELTDNTTAAGTWDHHHELPSNVEWTSTNVTFPQQMTMTNTTAPTSSTTGSIVTAGGLATSKTIWCGSGDIVLQNISGNYVTVRPQTGAFTNYDFVLPVSLGTSGQVLTSAGSSTAMTWTTPTTGTVTSIGMSVPTFLSVSPSTITSSGTFAVTLSGTALPVLNGGTGVTTSTGTGSNVLSTTPTFTSGIVLAAATSGNIIFVPPATVTSYSFIPPTTSGTSGQVLTSSAGSTMTWTTPTTGTVTSVGMSVPSFLSLSTSTITSSGTFAVTLSGTALPVVNGGTGVTTSTGTGSVVLSTSPAFSTNIRLNGSVSGILTVKAPDSLSGYTFTFPLLTGSYGQILTTDGTGATYWSTPASGGSTFTTPVLTTIVGTGSQLAYQGLVPSLATGNNVSLQLGTAASTNNSGVIYFKNTGGAGSALNELILGLYNNDYLSLQSGGAYFYTPVKYSNLSSTASVDAITALQANLATGNAVNFFFGKNTASYNSAYLSFSNSGGSGSSSNTLNLGFSGIGSSLNLAPINGNTVMSTSLQIRQVTGVGNGLYIFPTTAGNEASILFGRETTNTGDRWVEGQNVAGVGASNFALYSTAYGGWVYYFDVSSGATMWTRGVIKSNGDFLMTASVNNNQTFQLQAGSYQNGGIFLNAQTSSSYSALPANGRGSTNIGNNDLGNCLFVAANQEKYLGRLSANGIVNICATGSNGQYMTFYEVGTGASQGMPSSAIGSITRTAGGGVTYNTSSDYRLKENITTMPSSLTLINELQPVTFSFISDVDHKTVHGFIAHQVQQVFPEAVSGEKDAVDEYGNILPQSVSYASFTPILTKAVQELIAVLQQQQETITNLTQRIAKLESM